MVRAVVRRDGPVSAIEIARVTGLPPRHVSAALAYQKNTQRVIHISGWRRDEDGGHLYLRALYSEGQDRDARKPPPLTRSDYNKRHRQRVRSVASVFALATPISLRRVAGRLNQGTP